MQTSQVLEQSHTWVTQAVDDLPESEWEVPGVSGEWSAKDVVTHLAAYERLLLDILHAFTSGEPTPYVRTFLAGGEAFNKQTTEARKYEPAQQVLNEYQEAQVETTSALAQIPEEKMHETGTMPWYKSESSLADIVSMLNRHTKTHCDQIIAFRKRSR
ncbi:MAG TPA: DinB family protein [Ktedonobacteraceae bacterium]|nr:DinB family protein [Ktedonobacteraceae bacterium]